MKNSNQVIQARHDRLVAFLQQKETSTVPEMAKELNVSEITIRRDLHTLSNMGILTKFRGGAEIIQTSSPSEKINDKIETIKHALAKKAAEFVKPYDTLFINTSSTALLALNYVEDKRINVITNNMKVATINHNPNTTIILSGGEIRFPKEALVGDIAIDSFSKMTADISIIGCSGVSFDEGITTPIVHEAKINSLIIERTQGIKIVVADYRKIGIISNFLSSRMESITYLVTDSFTNPEMVKQIEKKGVIVIQVPI